jgi:hypothetical protein
MSTIIYYDQDGIVRAVGAEEVQNGLEDKMKAEWYPDAISSMISCDISIGSNIRMRPKSESTHKLPPLPERKAVTDVFAGFLKYVYGFTKV